MITITATHDADAFTLTRPLLIGWIARMHRYGFQLIEQTAGHFLMTALGRAEYRWSDHEPAATRGY